MENDTYKKVVIVLSITVVMHINHMAAHNLEVLINFITTLHPYGFGLWDC